MRQPTIDRMLPATVLISTKELAPILGFTTASALNKARVAGRLAFRMVKVAGRSGYFAYTEEVRAWLVSTASAGMAAQTGGAA